MSTHLQGFRQLASAQAEELLEAIAAAETIIVSTIERECEALRTGRMLAAEALHLRLCDAARLYLNATRAARASLSTIESVLPGIRHRFEERRTAFAAVLRIELAVLAAEHAAAEQFSPKAPAPPPPAQPRRPATAAIRVVAGHGGAPRTPTSRPSRLGRR